MLLMPPIPVLLMSASGRRRKRKEGSGKIYEEKMVA